MCPRGFLSNMNINLQKKKTNSTWLSGQTVVFKPLLSTHEGQEVQEYKENLGKEWKYKYQFWDTNPHLLTGQHLYPCGTDFSGKSVPHWSTLVCQELHRTLMVDSKIHICSHEGPLCVRIPGYVLVVTSTYPVQLIFLTNPTLSNSSVNARSKCDM